MSLRNIAIIAHVDHGKTTLVDELLKQSGVYRENERVQERAMDSGDIERERGITILAKATSVEWKGTRINIVDTPGHADFGGEVERILSMVDGAIVLVDAAEGPMPQTKFVVGKALKVGLRPIVAINKIDRPTPAPDEVINEVFDLFAALDATDEQLDFPILYGSGRNGWMAADRPSRKPADARGAAVRPGGLEHVPEAAPVAEGPFRMLGTILEANPFLGRIMTGRMDSGSIKPNQAVKAQRRRQADRKRPYLQDPRLPRPRAPAGRGSRRPATSSPLPACRRDRGRHVLRPAVTEPLTRSRSTRRP
jgi:GTP-binding protein